MTRLCARHFVGFCLVFAIHATAIAGEIEIFGIDTSTIPSRLLGINGRTGEATAISSTPNRRIDDIDFGPDGLLYGTDILDASPEGLVTLDPATGEVLSFVRYWGSNAFKSNHDLTFGPGGVLYLLNNESVLSIVNRVTGEVTQTVQATWSGYSAGLRAIDFAPDGRLFGVGLDNYGGVPDLLVILDPTDLSLVDIVGQTGTGNVRALRFADDGTLYGIDRDDYKGDSLIIIDPNTGAFDIVGYLSSNPNYSRVRGIAIRSAVPEPATLALLGLGLAGLGWSRYR